MLTFPGCRCFPPFLETGPLFETEFVEWACRFPQTGAGVVIGPGDDAALVDGKPSMLVTTDLLMDGVHFDLVRHAPRQIGRKALAVSLSDIAAMGGVPRFAVVQLAFPRDIDFGTAQQIQQGLLDLAREFDVALVGGDTNRWDKPLVIGTTVLAAPPDSPWRISGARSGDVLLVSGELGGSFAGRHLDFEPRCRLASWLAGRFEIHAATDISDSLSIDAANLAEQSGLALCLDLERIPVSAAAKLLCQGSPEPGPAALNRALEDGEDFELLLAVDERTANRIMGSSDLPVRLTLIGKFEPGSGLWGHSGGTERRRIEPRGYVH